MNEGIISGIKDWLTAETNKRKANKDQKRYYEFIREFLLHVPGLKEISLSGQPVNKWSAGSVRLKSDLDNEKAFIFSYNECRMTLQIVQYAHNAFTPTCYFLLHNVESQQRFDNEDISKTILTDEIEGWDLHEWLDYEDVNAYFSKPYPDRTFLNTFPERIHKARGIRLTKQLGL